MRKQIALGVFLALGYAGSALADGFSYSNVEASYSSYNPKGPGGKADGFGVSGSVEFNENFSGFAGYKDLDNTKWLNLGLGFNWGLGANLDLTSGLSYESVDSGPNASGYGLAVGLRGRLGEAFELTGGVKYIDLNKGIKAQTTFGVGARYYVTPNFAVGADVWDQDDFGKSWTIAVRYDFGNKN
ncbi:MAG: hypothetical protein ABIQ86_12625 [Steroidobacteraceae bacterium]